MLQIDTRKYSVHVGSGKVDGVTSPERFAQFTCDRAEAALHQMEWMDDQRLISARIGCRYGGLGSLHGQMLSMLMVDSGDFADAMTDIVHSLFSGTAVSRAYSNASLFSMSECTRCSEKRQRLESLPQGIGDARSRMKSLL
jgi:hypothetical protein